MGIIKLFNKNLVTFKRTWKERMEPMTMSFFNTQNCSIHGVPCHCHLNWYVKVIFLTTGFLSHHILQLCPSLWCLCLCLLFITSPFFRVNLELSLFILKILNDDLLLIIFFVTTAYFSCCVFTRPNEHINFDIWWFDFRNLLLIIQ